MQPAASTVNDGDMLNQTGLSRKHILDAVEKSVARLGTYIDVLQIHRLDRSVPREEIMRALNDVVESGKVRYLGASSMSCWEFQELQNIAERRGWHKFISMQNYYNLIYREEEREMIPYCNHTGVGLLPWSPVARGALTRPYNDRGDREKTDRFFHVSTPFPSLYHSPTLEFRSSTTVKTRLTKRSSTGLRLSPRKPATAWHR